MATQSDDKCTVIDLLSDFDNCMIYPALQMSMASCNVYCGKQLGVLSALISSNYKAMEGARISISAARSQSHWIMRQVPCNYLQFPSVDKMIVKPGTHRAILFSLLLDAETTKDGKSHGVSVTKTIVVH